MAKRTDKRKPRRRTSKHVMGLRPGDVVTVLKRVTVRVPRGAMRIGDGSEAAAGSIRKDAG